MTVQSTTSLADATTKPRRHRSLHVRPRIDTVVAVTIAVVMSLLPAVLPRTSVSQAIVTGVPVALAIGVAGLVRMTLGHWRFDVDERFGRHRVPILLVCGFVVTAVVVRAAAWQNGLHAAMGEAPVGAAYWLRCALGAAAIVVFLVGTGRGIRWGIRKLLRVDA
ncbi:putative membrane protein [Nocardia kruczakiae]|uniref:Membrane protein n=1 Tax=Nocardia kruczakiae TaxID=261477 RepID=A0ABU1XG19_9NOCA|nr:alpha/beta-hydrolase N-terminal domain-containing protein [Nocardia kruczakiae]MDR7169499.1 putative membrane protein [Nocardia kruczakiae]